MPGGKKALAILEEERLRAAGGGVKKGMKGEGNYYLRWSQSAINGVSEL